MKIRCLRTIGIGTVILNFIVQKLFRINSKAKFMVHYTSRINMAQNIHFDNSNKSDSVYTSLASSNGIYINASNGINFGKNILIASGVKLISANHDIKLRNKHLKSAQFRICEFLIITNITFYY